MPTPPDAHSARGPDSPSVEVDVSTSSHYWLRCYLAEGSSIAIRLGSRERQIEERADVVGRLILVTPRRILTEAGEEANVAPMAKPATSDTR